MLPDVERVSSAIREVAETELLPRFRRLRSGDVREKDGPLDLVTVADLAAEEALGARLGGLLAGSAILGEERAAADPSRFELIHADGPVWAVDPLDGTANFVAGRPEFAIMVALIEAGAVRAAWIHEPLIERTTTAVAGEGAWLTEGAGAPRRLRVAAPVPATEMTGVVKTRYLDDALRARVRTGAKALKRRRNFGCAGHEYVEAAAGRVDMLLYGRLLPWDHAPGWLVHREAGGCGARFDRGAYDPRIFAGGLMMAPDAASWEALHELLLADGAGARAPAGSTPGG